MNSSCTGTHIHTFTHTYIHAHQYAGSASWVLILRFLSQQLNIVIVALEIYLFLFYIYKCLACMRVGAASACGFCGGQKQALDPLELESQTVMECHRNGRS